jgi:mono/diheme cytochrome c family protein
MKSSLTGTAVLGAAMVFASSVAISQTKFDFGKREYDSNCASCHGVKGKGDGPAKPFLTKSPPDLTVLAKNNNGVLPVEHLNEVIDGRREVGSHGSRDMPIWGSEYRLKAAESHMDVPYDYEAFVRVRILALIDYINRLQAK